MKDGQQIKSSLLYAIAITVAAFVPTQIFAHCDTLDGPVIKAAQKALAEKNANLVLIWVKKDQEQEIQKAFEKTLAVRKLTPEAQELADMYFFETLVRIHRAGEGAPYTGLKPVGYDYDPAIEAAEQALDSGSLEPLQKILGDKMEKGVEEKFHHVLHKKSFDKNNVEAGREYVEAYVIYIHYVEGIYNPEKATPHEHSHEAKGHEYETKVHEEHVQTSYEHKEESKLEFKIPQPLKEEHEELHQELVKAIHSKGETGEAAKAVAKVLHPHFVKEEEYALPPLGLLSLLARGEIVPEMKKVFEMTDKLKGELPQMIQEHKNIVAALKHLSEVAEKEKKAEAVQFAQKLILHAQTEEQVLYPTAILVGEYLKSKLEK